MKTEAAVPRSNVDEEILKDRKRRHPPLFLQSPRRVMSRLRNKLCFRRIDFGTESHDGVAKSLNRFLIARLRWERENAGGKENNQTVSQRRYF